jgi:hypothetical protein
MEGEKIGKKRTAVLAAQCNTHLNDQRLIGGAWALCTTLHGRNEEISNVYEELQLVEAGPLHSGRLSRYGNDKVHGMLDQVGGLNKARLLTHKILQRAVVLAAAGLQKTQLQDHARIPTCIRQNRRLCVVQIMHSGAIGETPLDLPQGVITGISHQLCGKQNELPA